MLVDEMVTVRRANAVLTIKREDVERYIKKGYDVLDSKGNVVKASVPNDVNELQKAYVEHLATIKKLEAEIEELKASKKDVTTKATSSRKKATKDE